MRNLNERNIANIMFQILSAILYCHQKSIVHRDLKPENILLESENIDSNIKIIDFGTSKFLKSNEKMSEFIGTTYYIAPEIITHNYSFQCDIWSCGIIMHLLLTGTVPFIGKSTKETIKKIQTEYISYNSPIYYNISDNAIKLLQRMLIKVPELRVSAQEAINDSWITIYRGKNNISMQNLSQSLNNLRDFHSSINFQRAIISFISQRCISQEEEEKLRQIFKSIDKSGDGLIDKDELLKAYTSIIGDKQKAINQVEKILRKVDINKNNTLDYNEFLTANINVELLEKEENIRYAFNYFDEDKNGMISIDELKKIFKTIDDEGRIDEMFKDLHLGSITQIDYEHFKQILIEYISTSKK